MLSVYAEVSNKRINERDDSVLDATTISDDSDKRSFINFKI